MFFLPLQWFARRIPSEKNRRERYERRQQPNVGQHKEYGAICHVQWIFQWSNDRIITETNGKSSKLVGYCADVFLWWVLRMWSFVALLREPHLAHPSACFSHVFFCFCSFEVRRENRDPVLESASSADRYFVHDARNGKQTSSARASVRRWCKSEINLLILRFCRYAIAYGDMC